ncbi:MAG: dihydroorotase, partial [Chitinophagaceae bacterium]|nr:dihydroorotase [Chitinophagaceae bacterium]
MQIVVRQALISDSSSPFHGQQKDILIDGDIISAIEDHINTNKDAKIIEQDNLVASPGWVDSFANFNEPGFEYKETLQSGSEAAAAGGFTQVFAIPNTSPVIDAKSQVEFITAKNQSSIIKIHPLGAISKKIEGKELAEMFDMYNSGAIAFTDGLSPVQSSGLLLKALQYVKAFNGVIIQVPTDKSIQPNGLMHEGILSAQMGLPGLPAIAEELMIEKMISLLRYTESKLHISGISSGRSLQLIIAAKKEGLNISCSIASYHLFFCDEDLREYDTHLKTPLPLRSREDMRALREGVSNGDIDMIASFHLP